jgi:hypothetical protein
LSNDIYEARNIKDASSRVDGRRIGCTEEGFGNRGNIETLENKNRHGPSGMRHAL